MRLRLRTIQLPFPPWRARLKNTQQKSSSYSYWLMPKMKRMLRLKRLQNLNRKLKQTYPNFIQNKIIIAIWKKNKLEQHINKKFNKKGFFICKKINNKYEKICFGKPFDFNYFVNNIKNKNIIFDSGMYEGNSRNYSQFRSLAKNFWNILITEEY